MAGGGSFTSDQSVAHATGDGQMIPTTQRARITSIQAEGIANSVIVFKTGGSGGTAIATYKFGTEGMNLFLPGSGILFKEGVYLDLTNTPGVTITYT
jgi:hypothetical protein|tara:strand:+ start:297 stop:587 length:291 start_codon:yes stop_codon:yes gene_type:complete